MKRIALMAVVSATLVVPSLALVGTAGAANPHNFGEGQNSPGQGGDPNASCSDRPCNSPNLDFSEGCQNGQAPTHNPHCQPQEGTTTTPTSPSTTPSASTPAGQAGGVAGAKAKGGENAENQVAAGAAQGGNAAGQLAFTGLDALWLALLGAGMLASGLALRARSGSSA
jgi:hypothetical protein